MNRFLLPITLALLLIACTSSVNPNSPTVRPSEPRDGTGFEPTTAAQNGTTRSPDQTQIAFARPLADHSEIFVARADGSSPVPLTSGFLPSWSPAGTKIAFLRDPRNPSAKTGADPFVMQIWLVDPDGSELTKLAQRAGCCIGGVPSLAWSHDGSRILFSGIRSKRMNVATGA
jgi:hypothetical protein